MILTRSAHSGYQTTVPVPDPDEIPVRLKATETFGMVTPAYPVIAYPHKQEFGGDAIANGYVYRGAAIPTLADKFVLGDITTGRLYYADFAEMLAAHADNSPDSPVDLKPLHIEWENPYDGSGTAVYPDMFDIVKSAYHARGGAEPISTCPAIPVSPAPGERTSASPSTTKANSTSSARATE